MLCAVSDFAEIRQQMYIYRMFEEQTKRSFNFGWLLIIPILLTIAFVFNSLRVNTKPPATVVPEYTQKGTLLEETLTVGAGDFNSTKISLNRKDILKGSFKTTGLSRTVSCLVLDSENFEKWKARETYSAVMESGYLPTGKVNITLDPGIYFLVIDNRETEGETRPVELSFTIG